MQPLTYSEAMRDTHEVDSLIHRTARGLAPKIAEDALSSGCTHGSQFVSALGARQRKAYAAVAVAHVVNHATSPKSCQTKPAKVRSMAEAAKLARFEGLAAIADECERIAEMWRNVPDWQTDEDPHGFGELANRSAAGYYSEDLNLAADFFGSWSAEEIAGASPAGFVPTSTVPIYFGDGALVFETAFASLADGYAHLACLFAKRAGEHFAEEFAPIAEDGAGEVRPAGWSGPLRSSGEAGAAIADALDPETLPNFSDVAEDERWENWQR